jgi:GNAT superfamily N-acetyltransferase
MVELDSLEVTVVDTADEVALGRWLAVRNIVDPRPLTLAGFRAELVAATVHLELLAASDGVDVAAGGCAWGTISAESGTVFLEAWVTPGVRRCGIGSLLMDRCVAFAREHGMVIGRATAVDGDAGALAFADHYGLKPVGWGQLGHLHLTPTHVAQQTAPRPDGVQITSLADRPDLDRAVYDLDALVQPEVPTLALEPTPSFPAWRAGTVDDAGFLAELSLVALRDDHVVGSIVVYDNGDRMAFIGMTAVDPAARRQGIARALKVELAGRAARAGWERIETFNDGTNERMRALNANLGYVYQPRMVMLKGSFRPD